MSTRRQRRRALHQMETRPSSSAPIAHSVAASRGRRQSHWRAADAARRRGTPRSRRSWRPAPPRRAPAYRPAHRRIVWGDRLRIVRGQRRRRPRKLAGTQPGGANQTRILSRPVGRLAGKVEHGPVIGVGEDRVECAEPAPDAVDRRLDLILVGAEQAIPDDENAAVILVEILVVDAVMHPVVRRRGEYAVEPAEPADQLGVNPELVEEINLLWISPTFAFRH